MKKNLHFLSKGKYIVTVLILIICLVSCKKEEDVLLNVDFDYITIDSNYIIPVHILFNNKTSGASFYKWTFEGGTPATYDKRQPGLVTFDKTGVIVVTLEAWNDNERKSKSVTIVLDSIVKAGFVASPILNDFVPAVYNFENTSSGANVFSWQFAGSNITTSTEKNPSEITFTTPGIYRVFLEAKNSRGIKDTLSKLITIRPSLSAAFDIVPSFDDIDDYEAPLIATLQNHTISATNHVWQSNGGVIINPSDSIPVIKFSSPGTFTITYTAENGKQSQTVSKTISVKENTGMRSFNNVKFAINTADSTIGSYYSTYLRRSFKTHEINSSNAGKIDLCFFGLNSSFSYNKFISPDSVQNFTYPVIIGATKTVFVNKQELCNCNPVFDINDFDNAVNGAMLEQINITTIGEWSNFNNTITPRIILFKTNAGKKGAIKIRQFVSVGLQSYILCDIKVQKD